MGNAISWHSRARVGKQGKSCVLAGMSPSYVPHNSTCSRDLAKKQAVSLTAVRGGTQGTVFHAAGWIALVTPDPHSHTPFRLGEVEALQGFTGFT